MCRGCGAVGLNDEALWKMALINSFNLQLFSVAPYSPRDLSAAF